MLGVAGEPVVTTLVCFFIFARKAAGASRARYSLRPLGRKVNAKLGRFTSRECETVFIRHCEEHSCPPKPAFGRRRMRRSNPVFLPDAWIVSRSPSSGGTSRRPVGSQ